MAIKYACPYCGDAGFEDRADWVRHINAEESKIDAEAITSRRARQRLMRKLLNAGYTVEELDEELMHRQFGDFKEG